MSRGKRNFFIGISLLLVCILLISCIPNKDGGFTCVCVPLIKKAQSVIPSVKDKASSKLQPKDNASSSIASSKPAGPTRPHPPARTGAITTGASVQVASKSIPASGGMVTVDKPGDPLDGFVINIPDGSYPVAKTFAVSYAPITKQSFGNDINPVSPLITVENGGDYADEIMLVRVPVKVPEDCFAMGFIYDEKSKQLEGMPLVGIDTNSVTVATRHFSSFFVSMIKKALLKKDIDSGFRPGIDDWQFTNYGSYIAPGGHCEGQSLSAMWYYCTQPDGKDMCLYGRYDNNGEEPDTPDLWQDDSLGYRFCSVIQEENRDQFTRKFWDNLAGVTWEKVNNEWQMKHIPGIGDENIMNLFSYSIQATHEPQEVGIRSNAGGGHAMIVYKIIGNALYVADPNYPGDTDRKIMYYSTDGKFKPYNSGANRQEIEAGQGKAYENIQYLAKSTVVPWDKIAQHWSEFKNKTIGNDKFPGYRINIVNDEGRIVELTDGFSTTNKMLRIGPNRKGMYIVVFRDGKQLPFDKDMKVELVPGDNMLGIWVRGEVNNSWEYVDFKYFNVIFDDGSCDKPMPPDMLAKLQKMTSIKCDLSNLPCTVEGHGSMHSLEPGAHITVRRFYVPGNAFEGAFERGGPKPVTIKWSGSSFSGGGSQDYPDKLTGNVCYSGGQLLVSFDYTTNDPTDNLHMVVKNLPCDPHPLVQPASGRPSELYYHTWSAPLTKEYVTILDWKSHQEEPVFMQPNEPPEIWDATLVDVDWSDKCDFLVEFSSK